MKTSKWLGMALAVLTLSTFGSCKRELFPGTSENAPEGAVSISLSQDRRVTLVTKADGDEDQGRNQDNEDILGFHNSGVLAVLIQRYHLFLKADVKTEQILCQKITIFIPVHGNGLFGVREAERQGFVHG